jgi:hypothetical protein
MESSRWAAPEHRLTDPLECVLSRNAGWSLLNPALESTSAGANSQRTAIFRRLRGSGQHRDAHTRIRKESLLRARPSLGGAS